MAEFISLKELRDRVWPLAVTKNLATDMTGVSLPILEFSTENASHPYRVNFMLYYAVPGSANAIGPDNVTGPYALVKLDLQSGELVQADVIRSVETPNPLIGPGVSKKVFELPDDDRRNLQDLFFSRCDEVARIYAGGNVSQAQIEYLVDLLGLYENLSEPPLLTEYETHGKAFFTWLRNHAENHVQ